MTKSALFLIPTGILLCAQSLSANDKTATYNNYNDNKTSWWGTSKAESYDIAVKIDNEEFYGLDISEIKFNVADDEGISGYKIWLSSSLSLEDKTNVPDILSKDISPLDGKLSLMLDNPYTIPEGGVYVGYSFTVESTDNTRQKKPVIIIKGEDAAGHGMWLHTSTTYKKWTDYASAADSWIPFELTLGNLKGESISLSLPEEINGAIGQPVKVNAHITNQGCSKIEELSVTFSTGDFAGKCDVQYGELPEGVFNATAPVYITLPPFDNTLNTPVEISVEKVNGLENFNSRNSCSSSLNIWSRLPLRTPLFEEYTGTGCGYCPRGSIGIEKLHEIFGERFVAVAYHCNDIMSIFKHTEDFPNYAPAQPVAWIDRILETDPYFGDNTDGVFNADKAWEEMAERFTPADIELSCQWGSNDEESIEAHANVSFVKPFEESDFRLTYILTADGLKGEGEDWLQGNYYSGESEKWPEDFSHLVESERYMDNMTYDHVAIFSSLVNGIEGIIPSDIKADQEFQHSITIDLKDAVNTRGMSLVQDKSKIRVVAAIVDAASGEIINCAMASPAAASVEMQAADAKIISEQYFNLLGQPVEAGHKGITIHVTTLSSGKKIVKKIIR